MSGGRDSHWLLEIRSYWKEMTQKLAEETGRTGETLRPAKTAAPASKALPVASQPAAHNGPSSPL
jgi:hypothetical protein